MIQSMTPAGWLLTLHSAQEGSNAVRMVVTSPNNAKLAIGEIDAALMFPRQIRVLRLQGGRPATLDFWEGNPAIGVDFGSKRLRIVFPLQEFLFAVRSMTRPPPMKRPCRVMFLQPFLEPLAD